MKSLPPGLQAHLDSGATTLAWCWRVERRDGALFGFTDHDRPLSFGGLTYAPETGLSPAEIRSGSDLAVDAQDALGALTAAGVTEDDIVAGLWDDATVKVMRVNWRDPSQRVELRRGVIGQIRRGRHSFVAEVRSLAHKLQQPVGRTYQFTCDAVLGDGRCGVNLDAPANKASGTVQSVLDARSFDALGVGGYGLGFFALGALEWTSGANEGPAFRVSDHAKPEADWVLTLMEPPPKPIKAGDGFVVRAGCDKMIETCRSRFDNVVNFRGFPTIPGSNAVLRYARRGNRNDGSPL